MFRIDVEEVSAKQGICNFLVLFFCTIFTEGIHAQSADGCRFGGWHFIEVNHEFKDSKWSLTDYFEHDNYEYRRLSCWYNRIGVGYKLLPFLKTSVNYNILRESGEWVHRGEFDLQGTLIRENLSVSIRERFVHSWFTDKGCQSDVLRSRLKVKYKLPKTRLAPYVMMEVFTWKAEWKKTRHYLGMTYDIDKHVQLDAYYLYYTYFQNSPEHMIGFGLNLDI